MLAVIGWPPYFKLISSLQWTEILPSSPNRAFALAPWLCLWLFLWLYWLLEMGFFPDWTCCRRKTYNSVMWFILCVSSCENATVWFHVWFNFSAVLFVKWRAGCLWVRWLTNGELWGGFRLRGAGVGFEGEIKKTYLIWTAVCVGSKEQHRALEKFQLKVHLWLQPEHLWQGQRQETGKSCRRLFCQGLQLRDRAAGGSSAGNTPRVIKWPLLAGRGCYSAALPSCKRSFVFPALLSVNSNPR